MKSYIVGQSQIAGRGTGVRDAGTLPEELMGTALPEDAWLRYGHVRGELAGVDARLHAFDIDAMLRRGLVDGNKVDAICELLEEQAAHAASFGDAASALRDALRAR